MTYPRLVPMLTILTALLCSDCKKSGSSPVAADSRLPANQILSSDYVKKIDSAYYKKWSDSSWGRFNQSVTVNGIRYTTYLNSVGNEYYFDSVGQAGAKIPNQVLTFYDKQIKMLPDTLTFGTTYTQESSMFYRGTNCTSKYELAFLDTVSSAVPIGIFKPCIYLTLKTTVTAGKTSAVTNTQYWYAKGPNCIKQTLNSGITIAMVNGTVNGKFWGMTIQSKLNGPSNRMSQVAVDTSFITPFTLVPL